MFADSAPEGVEPVAFQIAYGFRIGLWRTVPVEPTADGFGKPLHYYY